jgi:hypothetical protein
MAPEIDVRFDGEIKIRFCRAGRLTNASASGSLNPVFPVDRRGGADP